MSAPPTLTPVQNSVVNILPETGSFSIASNVNVYALGMYADSSNTLYDANFISGAVDQVRYVYRELAGDILDIELTEKNICHSYESAVLEYGYLHNLHQAKNSIGSALGGPTGTFNHDGQILESSMTGSNYALKYPKWDFSMTRRVARRYSIESSVGGDETFFSASIPLTPDKQEYDLQLFVSASAASGTVNFANLLGNNRIEVKRVYYKSPALSWRFFGYYGGFNTVGNLSTYGMYADDSTWEVVPVYQNKLQAMAYEDAVRVRNSHYSYDIRNNRLRLFPTPQIGSPNNVWIEFIIPTKNPWQEAQGTDGSNSVTGAGAAGAIGGVNNINTLPFSNIPFRNINSIGKQWIRRFSLAICKGMLAQARGKITSGIPIPNDTIQLNHAELLNQSTTEKEQLREELKKYFEETLYKNIAKDEADMTDNTQRTIMKVPLAIMVG